MPSEADVQAVNEGLRGYNLQHAPDNQYRELTVLLRDESGALVGGLLGGTYWGWLYIAILWLDERARGQGYGTQVIAAAEAEAARRGCRHVHLDTLSFQARPFYEKLGYTLYGQLEDLPPGHTRYFFRKDLGAGE